MTHAKESTKQFRASPFGAVVEIGKGSQCNEIRQNLATFCEFWDKFSNAKWLAGLVAPEFEEKKQIAKKLLDTLQNKSQTQLPTTGPKCPHCSQPRGSDAYCPACGLCSHGFNRNSCRIGCRSQHACNYCYQERQPYSFCKNSGCGYCIHGYRKAQYPHGRCPSGCTEAPVLNKIADCFA